MALLQARSPFIGRRIQDYKDKKQRLLSSYDDKKEYVNNGMIYCKKCRTARLCDIPERSFVVRCACDCEDKAWREEKEKKEREYGYFAFWEKRKAIHSIGRIFLNASFYRFEMRKDGESIETVTRCEGFCNSFDDRLKDGKGIWLYGGIGTGKTYLAVSMFNRLECQHYRCVFTSASTIFSAIKGQYGREDGALMQVIESADVVFIDKIDEAFMTPTESVYAAKKLGEIVRLRYEDNKPTVVIGESSIIDFSAKKNISESNVDIMISAMDELRLNGRNRRKTDSE